MNWIKWKRSIPTSNRYAAKSFACCSLISDRPQHANDCTLSDMNLTFSQLPSMYLGLIVARDLIITVL